ncbi:MAG TPA: hypothetical protein PK970_09215 [Hyphomicrobiaceae bacterium]|nr:hypothetical protein [Hyphomicrobiaceae bacterium]
MRRWHVAALIAVAIGWVIGNNIGSSLALSEFAARPVVAFTRADVRVPVAQRDAPSDPSMARLLHGEGISFGYRFKFVAPDGGLITCDQKFRQFSCSDGWLAERSR